MRAAGKTYDVAVVGGGHNGLTCAALIAKAGLSVAVFEKCERIGGAAVSEHPWSGYTVSTASYVCTLLDPWLIEELELERHGYRAYRKEPATFTALEDGRSLLLGADEDANEREIAAFDRADVEGYRELDMVLRRLGGELFDTFSDDVPRFDRFSPRTRELLCGSAAEIVESYVDTPVLQAAIATDGIIGTFRGPRDAGTGYVLAHHYAGRALGVQGAWGYVRGGMGAISNSLASAARAYGADIFSGSPVRRIIIEDGRAAGIVLADGTEVRSHSVASNAHPRTTFVELLQGEIDGVLSQKLSNWESEGCSLKINLAIGELPDFRCRPGRTAQPHHRATIHIAPSLEYLQQAYDDARSGTYSLKPMLECFLQTPTETDLAPRGKHILSIFAQYYPYGTRGGWNESLKKTIADSVVGALAAHAPNVPNAIEAMQILSPVDFEAQFGLCGGHIFHGELLPGQIYEQRFDHRTPFKNLYLCGSGTHPGGCVSGFPGKRAAAAILSDVRQATIA